jgi:crotonobetainyl-CoA:carnitine CoA-transferase CaiB-like acyl-CoA transferase
MEWFREIIAAGVPCGPINTVDGGVGFATEIGLEPVVEVGEGDAMVPSIRHPITLSQTPADYRLPPPGLDEHGDEIRAWLSGDGDIPVVEEVAQRPSRNHGDGEDPR